MVVVVVRSDGGGVGGNSLVGTFEMEGGGSGSGRERKRKKKRKINMDGQQQRANRIIAVGKGRRISKPLNA